MFKRKSNKTESQQSADNSERIQLISSAPKIFPEYNDLVKVLSDAIDSNEDNCNIGVIGSFGTGKSSFLKLFKSKNKNHKIVTVSLANFQNQNSNNNSDIEDKHKVKIENEKYLESIIIQQILYSAKRSSLPASRIKRIGFRVRSILLLIFLVLASVSLVLYDRLQIDQEFLWARNLLLYSSISLFAVSFIFLVLCFPLTSVVASFHGVQIKSEPNINSTLFDEYLDELIYFFHKTKTDIVIFEDIDRCANDDIFNKLRTLNFTLNNSPYFKSQKIRFIYAVREDLFISSETRSKFFDILISLPPLISKSNSYEHLSTVLKNNNVFKFDDRFLIEIGSFIDSYRQINNIVNDFMVFSLHKYKSKPLELSVAKRLFTILTFKSLYPYDYLLFVKGSGYLWHLVIKGKADYTVNNDYKDVYLNPSNKNVCDSIGTFYSSLNKYIDISSISLVSYFVPAQYKTQEEKIFYESIKDNIEYFAPEYTYENAKDIVYNEDAIDNHASSLFLNISLLKEIIIMPVTNAFAEQFFESFNLNTEQQLSFVKCVIKHLNDETDMCFNFFERIAPYCSNLVKFLNEADFFSNPLHSKRFFKECINNKYSLAAQNNNDGLIDIINKSEWADEIICNFNDECIAHILTKTVNVPRLDLEQFYKGDSDYKDNFIKLVNSGKFKRNVSNYNAFVKALSYSQKINKELPMLAQLFLITTDTNSSQIKASFIKNINEVETDGVVLEGDKFEICKNEIIINILNTIKNSKVINAVIDKCGIINVSTATALPLPLLTQLALNEKLNAPISIWDLLCKGNEELTVKFVHLIFTNFSLYLNNENNKDDSYFPLLLKIVNDKRCDYSLAGKIFELTCEQRTLQLDFLTNKEATKCAIDYQYCIFNSADIDKISEDLLLEYVTVYRSDIASLNDSSINLSMQKLEVVLKDNSIEIKCLVLNKLVSSINKENANLIKNTVESLDDPFKILSPTFIELYLSSKYVFGDSVTNILLNHYCDISNFDQFAKNLSNNKVRFSCSSLEIKKEFKTFVKETTNGKCYIRQSEKKYFIFIFKK